MLEVGQHVRHYMSRWEGKIAEISEVEACGQGRLITVDLTWPATPPNGRPWKAITVTEAELEPIGEQ